MGNRKSIFDLAPEGIGYKLLLADDIFQSTKSSIHTQGSSWCQSICPVSFKKRTASGSKGSAAGFAGPRATALLSSALCSTITATAFCVLTLLDFNSIFMLASTHRDLTGGRAFCQLGSKRRNRGENGRGGSRADLGAAQEPGGFTAYALPAPAQPSDPATRNRNRASPRPALFLNSPGPPASAYDSDRLSVNY